MTLIENLREKGVSNPKLSACIMTALYEAGGKLPKENLNKSVLELMKLTDEELELYRRGLLELKPCNPQEG